MSADLNTKSSVKHFDKAKKVFSGFVKRTWIAKLSCISVYFSDKVENREWRSFKKWKESVKYFNYNSVGFGKSTFEILFWLGQMNLFLLELWPGLIKVLATNGTTSKYLACRQSDCKYIVIGCMLHCTLILNCFESKLFWLKLKLLKHINKKTSANLVE